MATFIEDTDPSVATTPPIERCPNCGAELVGEYCHQCGQKKLHLKEYSVRQFLGRLVNDFTDLESNKILRTLSALVIRPGLLATEYLAGRKGNYIGPVKLYLTFSALYFLFAWGALSDIRGGGSERTARHPATISMARARGVPPKVLADQIYQKAEKYATALRFSSVLISGLFLSALYFRMKKYYVEHLIFSLYYYSFDFLSKCVFALLFIVVAAMGMKLPGRVLDLFYPVGLVYLIFALRRVYRQGWTMTLVKSLALYVCETILFIAVNVAGFFIAYAFI